MTGSKGTRAGIRVTQAYTVAAVSAFFDRLWCILYSVYLCCLSFHFCTFCRFSTLCNVEVMKSYKENVNRASPVPPFAISTHAFSSLQSGRRDQGSCFA